MAYEKASILFQIAVTHSTIATSQSRSDPEGLKRAFYYFRTCAGVLSYINENFLHAPSTDLSREVVEFLIGIILAQATEVFLEDTMDSKKGSGLVSNIAAQAAGMYISLNEEVKEFMGKGIFDKNWVTLIQASSLLSYPYNLLTGCIDQIKILFLPSPIPPRPGRLPSRQTRRRPRPICTLRIPRKRSPRILHLLLHLLRIQPLPKPSPRFWVIHARKSQSPLCYVCGPKRRRPVL
jgi:hypothetical protein